eukprot:COSAG01_NODE_5807_length_4021_cov_30.092810_3_plen_688_part_01
MSTAPEEGVPPTPPSASEPPHDVAAREPGPGSDTEPGPGLGSAVAGARAQAVLSQKNMAEGPEPEQEGHYVPWDVQVAVEAQKSLESAGVDPAAELLSLTGGGARPEGGGADSEVSAQREWHAFISAGSTASYDEGAADRHAAELRAEWHIRHQEVTGMVRKGARQMAEGSFEAAQATFAAAQVRERRPDDPAGVTGRRGHVLWQPDCRIEVEGEVASREAMRVYAVRVRASDGRRWTTRVSDADIETLLAELTEDDAAAVALLPSPPRAVGMMSSMFVSKAQQTEERRLALQTFFVAALANKPVCHSAAFVRLLCGPANEGDAHPPGEIQTRSHRWDLEQWAALASVRVHVEAGRISDAAKVLEAAMVDSAKGELLDVDVDGSELDRAMIDAEMAISEAIRHQFQVRREHANGLYNASRQAQEDAALAINLIAECTAAITQRKVHSVAHRKLDLRFIDHTRWHPVLQWFADRLDKILWASLIGERMMLRTLASTCQLRGEPPIPLSTLRVGAAVTAYAFMLSVIQQAPRGQSNDACDQHCIVDRHLDHLLKWNRDQLSVAKKELQRRAHYRKTMLQIHELRQRRAVKEAIQLLIPAIQLADGHINSETKFMDDAMDTSKTELDRQQSMKLQYLQSIRALEDVSPDPGAAITSCEAALAIETEETAEREALLALKACFTSWTEGDAAL